MPGGAHTPAPVRWSPRERDVLDLVARGLTNAEIATQLGITFATAKWHVSELITKLGVDSREEVAAYWRRERSPAGRSRSWLRGLLGLGALKLAAGSAAVAGVAGVAIVGTVILGGVQASSESTTTPTPAATSAPVAPGMIDTFAPEIGKPAPNFALPDVNDPSVLHRLSDYTGNAVVVAFVGTSVSCSACRGQLGLLKQMLESASRPTTVLVIVPEGERTEAATLMDGLGVTFVAVSDSASSQVQIRYRAESVPGYIFVGPDGVLQDRMGGFREEDEFWAPLAHAGVRVAVLNPIPQRQWDTARPAACPTSAPVGTDGLLCSWRNWPLLVAGDKGNCDLSSGDYGGNLAHIDLRGCRIDNASFFGQPLPQSKLNGVSAVGTKFPGAMLGDTDLTGANLRGADLHRAYLGGANFTDANLLAANLVMAELSGVIWKNTICPDGSNSDSHNGTCLGTRNVSQRPSPDWGPPRY